jgi:hypothetical protein
MAKEHRHAVPANLFPDYDPAAFLVDIPHGSEGGLGAEQNIRQARRALPALLEQLRQRSHFLIPPLYKFAHIPSRDHLQPHVRYAIHQHRLLSRRLKVCTQQFFRSAAEFVAALLLALKEKKRAGIPVHCFWDQLDPLFATEYEKRAHLTRTLARIMALKTYGTRHFNSLLYPSVPIEMVRLSMRESAQNVVETIEYCGRSQFDDIFSFFLCGSCEFGMKQMDEFVAQVSPGSEAKRVDLKGLNSVVQQFIQLLKPNSAAETIVVKFGVYRLFFDRFYLTNPRWLNGEDGCGEKLAIQCDRIRWLTARQMSIPDRCMRKETMDMAFATLARTSPQIQHTAELISSLQFMTDPTEILATLFSALKAGEDVVRQNEFENRFGGWTSMVDRDKVSSTDHLAFDDFFPLFCLLFSLSPPINAVPIARFLGKLTGLSLSPAFDFAKLFFTSAVEYSETVNLADLTVSPADDEEDPLGVSHLRSSETVHRISALS